MRRLTEELGATLEGATDTEIPPTPPEPENTGVAFRLHGDDLFGSWIFAGRFFGAVPQRRPLAGVLLDAPGVYRVGPSPNGSHHLMAALGRSEEPLDLLLIGFTLRVDRGSEPTLLARGRDVAGMAEVEMRPPRNTDPPVLLALPTLLPKLLAAPSSP